MKNHGSLDQVALRQLSLPLGSQTLLGVKRRIRNKEVRNAIDQIVRHAYVLHWKVDKLRSAEARIAIRDFLNTLGVE